MICSGSWSALLRLIPLPDFFADVIGFMVSIQEHRQGDARRRRLLGVGQRTAMRAGLPHGYPALLSNRDGIMSLASIPGGH